LLQAQLDQSRLLGLRAAWVTRQPTKLFDPSVNTSEALSGSDGGVNAGAICWEVAKLADLDQQITEQQEKAAKPLPRRAATSDARLCPLDGAPATERIESAIVGIKFQQGLHLGSQRIKPLAHIRDATSQIDAEISGWADHRKADRICRNAPASTSPATRSFMPFGSFTSTLPAKNTAGRASTGAGNAGISGTIETGMRPVSMPPRNCLRHV
jgi:hypothetical protein